MSDAGENDSGSDVPALPLGIERGGLIYRVWERVGLLTRNRIWRPFALQAFKHHRSQDAERNAELVPGPDQHVEVEGLWAVEFFMPSQIGGVLRQMRLRGWASELSERGGRDLVGWLNEMRRTGGQGSHSALFMRSQDRSFTTSAHEAALPSFAAHADAEFFSLTPSISGVCVFFVLKPEYRDVLERSLRRTYATKIEPKGRAITSITPRFARQRAVTLQRRAWRAEIGRWLRGHTPGLLSQRIDDADLVTCELMVTSNVPVFEDPPIGTTRPVITSLLGAAFASLTFDDASSPKAIFAANPCHDAGLEGHSILAIEKAVLEQTVHQLNHGAGEFRFVEGVDEAFRRTLRAWSLVQVERLYQRLVNTARDQAAHLVSSPRSLQLLARLRTMTAQLSEATLFSREIEDLIADGEFNIIEGYDLRRRRWRPSDQTPSVQQFTRALLERSLPRLRQAHDDLQTNLATQANLASAHANLRLQVIVGLVAGVGLLLAAISGGEAAINLWDRLARPQESPAEAVSPAHR